MDQDTGFFRRLLKGYRQDLNLTQAQLGEKLGYSKPYVCDIEQGYRKPSVEFVRKFCAAMGMERAEAKIWHLNAARACGWDV